MTPRQLRDLRPQRQGAATGFAGFIGRSLQRLIRVFPGSANYVAAAVAAAAAKLSGSSSKP